MPRRDLTHRLLAGGEIQADAVREIASAFRDCGGNAVWSARCIGVPHRTLMRWVARYPELSSALEATRSPSARDGGR